MTREQVKAEIRQLANHQGFYGRLLEELNEAPEEDQNAFYDQFKDCNDIVDFIMTIEGQEEKMNPEWWKQVHRLPYNLD